MIRLRPAQAADLIRIIALERASPTAAHWSEAEYEKLTGLEQLLVAEDEERGSIVGFLAATCIGDQCEIENILVEPQSQRHGIACSLLQHFIQQAKEHGARELLLEVRSKNVAARNLYVKCGFIETGLRHGYYHNPDDHAVIYQLNLRQP